MIARRAVRPRAAGVPRSELVELWGAAAIPSHSENCSSRTDFFVSVILNEVKRREETLLEEIFSPLFSTCHPEPLGEGSFRR